MSDYSAYHDTPEEELRRLALQNHLGNREFLKTLAGRYREDLTLYESGLALPALLLLGAGAFAWWGINISGSENALIMSIVLGCLAVLYMASVLLRRKKPLFTLGSGGIVFPGDDRPLPWTGVAGFKASKGTYCGMAIYTQARIMLSPDTAMPRIRKDGRVKPHVRSHEIRLSALGFSKMDTRAFEETFTGYWDSGLARDELARGPIDSQPTEKYPNP